MSDTGPSGELYHYLMIALQRPFTTSKIIMLLANAVKFLAKVNSLSGSEKKTLALHTIRQVVNDSPYVLDDEKTGLLLLIDTFGDTTINVLVDFAKNSYLYIQRKNRCAFLCTKSSTKRSVPTTFASDKIEEYDALKDMIMSQLQKPITGPKIILLLTEAVRAVELYKNLSGSEKKAIVIKAIREIIVDLELTGEDRTLLLLFIDTLADETINYLVDFGRDTYMFAKKSCCF